MLTEWEVNILSQSVALLITVLTSVDQVKNSSFLSSPLFFEFSIFVLLSDACCLRIKFLYRDLKTGFCFYRLISLAPFSPSIGFQGGSLDLQMVWSGFGETAIPFQLIVFVPWWVNEITVTLQNKCFIWQIPMSSLKRNITIAAFSCDLMDIFWVKFWNNNFWRQWGCE